MSKCSMVLRQEGKTYPRTCAVHGLSGCGSPAAAARPAQPKLGRELFRFDSFDGWVRNASREHSRAGVCAELVVAVDARGRVCRLARHWIAARDDGAFPVVVYLVREDEHTNNPRREAASA